MLGPLLDRNVTGKCATQPHGSWSGSAKSGLRASAGPACRRWVFNFDWSLPALAVLAASCSAAIFVNMSQFACLGRFSAVSFQASLGLPCYAACRGGQGRDMPALVQVLGHSKTVCVLLGGWAFLGDIISFKQLMGMLTAVAGMVLYGFATCVPPAAAAATSARAAMAVHWLSRWIPGWQGPQPFKPVLRGCPAVCWRNRRNALSCRAQEMEDWRPLARTCSPCHPMPADVCRLPGKSKEAEPGSKIPQALGMGAAGKARHSHSGTPDDPLAGPDARVDVSLRTLLSPSRGGSPARHKAKASDAV